MRVSDFFHTYKLVFSESGITLLLLNWKSSLNYFIATEKNLFKISCDER